MWDLTQGISWIPARAAACALIEARNAASDLSPLHLAHPRPVLWKSLFEPLSRLYELQPVTYGMWFTRLTQSAEWAAAHQLRCAAAFAPSEEERTPTTPDANPALTLVSFFAACHSAVLSSQIEGRHSVEALGLPRLDVTKMSTIAAKTALDEKNLKQLCEEDLMKWLRYWEKTGFLPSRQ